MMRAGIAALALIAGGMPMAQAQEALAPAARWNVDFSDNTCIGSRQYGTGPGEVLFAVRMLPMTVLTDVAILIPERSRFARGGDAAGTATITFDSGRSFSAPYDKGDSGRPGLRLVLLHVDQEVIEAMGGAKTIAIKIGRGDPMTLQLSSVPAMMRVADTCKTQLLRSWNIDPATMANVARRAIPRTPPQSWVRSTDYPVVPRNTGVGGRTVVRLSIDAAGMPTDCAAVISSGDAALDARGCKALMERARFLPARDREGGAVPYLIIQGLHWRIG